MPIQFLEENPTIIPTIHIKLMFQQYLIRIIRFFVIINPYQGQDTKYNEKL